MSAPHDGVLLVRDDGVIEVPHAVPVVCGLVEAIERLFEGLGIPARDERCGPADPDSGGRLPD